MSNSANTQQAEDPMSYLYTKNFHCPVCDNEFMDFMIRRSKLRALDTQSDLRTIYASIDPNLYEVLLCNYCGYAALHSTFSRISSRQQDMVKEKITPKHKYVEFSVPLTPADALARFKLALACCQAIDAKASAKAIICWKMAWIYRDAKDQKSELTLLKIAFTGLKEAYTTEDFPLGNLDEHTTKFVIAELARRLGEYDECLRFLGELIVSRATPPRIKNRAQDMREALRAEREGAAPSS